jgi:hypothetical protein
MANKLTFRGHHIEVDYTIGGNPSVIALSYKKGSFCKAFRPGEIHADPTVLGSRVSVALVKIIDSGGKLFAFLLPQIDVPQGQTAHFTTVAFFEHFSGPNSIPHRPTTGRLSGLRVRPKPCWYRSNRESGLRRLPGAPVQMFRQRRRRWRLRFPRSAMSSSLIGATLPSIPSVRHDMVMRCRVGGRRFTARGHLACRRSTCSR